MPTMIECEPGSDRELVLCRLIAAPRAAVYRAWTEPALLTQWFTPAPWQTTEAVLDVRPGGAFLTVMRGPDGEEIRNPGVYLDVVPGTRLVFTDAFIEAWIPSEQPFMTAEVFFDDDALGTRYTARVRHWTVADREAHEKMGFHQGWGAAAEQLEEMLRGAAP